MQEFRPKRGHRRRLKLWTKSKDRLHLSRGGEERCTTAQRIAIIDSWYGIIEMRRHVDEVREARALPLNQCPGREL